MRRAAAAAGCLLLPGRVRGRVAGRRLLEVFGLQEFIVVGVRVLGVSFFLFRFFFGGGNVLGSLFLFFRAVFSGGFRLGGAAPRSLAARPPCGAARRWLTHARPFFFSLVLVVSFFSL